MVAQSSKPEQQSDRAVSPLENHASALETRLSTLEQENASLQSRLQSCERSHAVLQAEVAEYRRREQDGQERAKQEQTAELTVPNDFSLEPRLLEAIAEVTNTLLTVLPFDRAVNTALKIIGKTLETDRISVHENFGYPTDTSRYWRTLYDWNSETTMAQVAHPEAGQGSYEPIHEWYERMEQGQSISYLIEDAPEPFRSGQIAIGVKATHLVPISVERQFWGVLGLDDCREAKRRSLSELAILKIAADCIGSAIERERTQQALLQAEQERSQQLERHNAELQQTLDRLAESEHRYRTLFELSNEGIYRFEFEQPISTSLPVEEQLDLVLQHYRYAEANETFCTQMGLSIGQLQDFTLNDFHGDLEANRQVNRSILSDGYQIRNAETDELDALGRRKYFLNNVVCDVREGYLWGGWCTQTDITELRETQQALLKAEKERSAELAKANEALRNAIAGLARLDDLDQFLAEMLKVSIEISGAQNGAVDLVEGDDICHAVLFDKAGLVSPQTQAEQGLLRSPFSAELREMVQRILESEDAWVIYPNESIHPSNFQVFHCEQGNCAIRLVPMRIGDRLLGWLGLGFAEKNPPLGKSFVLLRVLAEQMTMAVELLRLAEAAKQSAIAREQEKAAQERAAELERANNALQNTVAALADRRDLKGFIGEVLHTIAREFESPLVEYWKVLGSDTVEINTWLYNDQLCAKHNDEHPGRGGIRLLPEYTDFEKVTHRCKPLTFTKPIPAYSLALGQIICPIEWYAERGVSGHFNFPLQAGDTSIGAISVWLPIDRQVTEECLRLGQALSHQTALAIQLTQLAEEAKQAAIYEERNRMAREIHDTLAQAFTGISLQLEVAKSLIQSDPQALQQSLNHISQLAEDGLTEARRSVWALYPPAAEYANLAQLLYESVEQMTRSTAIAIEINVQGTPCCLPPFIGMNLLRIGQEALTNALKHAQAQTITIELVYEADRVLLTICDNGRGFIPPTTIDNLNGGFGLMGMYERCDRINAQLSLTSQPGQGTQILVEAALS